MNPIKGTTIMALIILVAAIIITDIYALWDYYMPWLGW